MSSLLTHHCPLFKDLNYLEETARGPTLTVATLPKSGKIVLLQVKESHVCLLHSPVYVVSADGVKVAHGPS